MIETHFLALLLWITIGALLLAGVSMLRWEHEHRPAR